MKRKKDLTDYTGYKFYRLTVLKNVGKKFPHWLCKCDCGNEIVLIPSKLKKYKSCGCLEEESRNKLIQRTIKHGKTNTILYGKYCGMKERCYNPNYQYYNRYGGRGIKICDEWLGEHGFENFYKWAYENGYDDNKFKYEQTIDRIDIDKNYSPDNCRWISQKEQVWNRSISVNIQDGNEQISSVEFSKRHGITKKMFVYRRIKKGYTADQILKEWEVIANENSLYYTLDEASKYYNVSQETIKNRYRKGVLNGVKAGNNIYILKNQNTEK